VVKKAARKGLGWKLKYFREDQDGGIENG